MKIMDWSGTPAYQALLNIEDPSGYRDRLTMPKYLVNATGDHFFHARIHRSYFDRFERGEVSALCADAEHSLRGTVRSKLQAYYDVLLNGRARPTSDWKFEKDGSIRVKASGEPTAVKLWQTTNPKARDFRVDTIGRTWTARMSPVERMADG